ncbi:2,3-bisphosphoglycerate-independent phosphoglycerate mutase [Dissulfurirhabdus thermomarina]|uniref:2,3-bisphosphoglycerate-independent phosphoglycerate mutase n=1 Tax=Dissulfurirhabdus thermomarina TaxID=1765737 RepID=A0A6N9TKN0_DISTH|nr:alkaline phosphatase family protein [Dissulfurirhabdus thermomarina]NDY41628.1 2,3-bisphosphoglycerate-independent phosphoglycerate mutase [Dissulfurirhabdus thermomarina]NMX23329.1 2,3-bisphosphoglycerate-independent phosphoglycerate mutase [Dissulfurirhabdus thermomarina]
MPERCLLVILDGIGDRAVPSLGHRTPLQAAATPHLDRLAAAGACGLLHADRPGVPLPSENAHFALFGYEPAHFPGRGALEALGAGLPLETGDVAVLARLDHVEAADGLLRLGPELPGAAPGEAEALAAHLGPLETHGLRLAFHPVRGPFGILRIQGGAVPWFTDSDPMTRGAPMLRVRPWAGAPEPEAARRSAAAVEAYLRRALDRLPAHRVNRMRTADGRPPLNTLVTQRPGRAGTAPGFRRRWGLRGLSIGSGLLYKGIAAFLGLDFREDPDGGDPGADLARRLRMAAEAAGHDFVHVHTKAPDQAAHTKTPEEKVRIIETLDRGLGESAVIEDPSLLLVVTADHSTPSMGPLVHSGEPVPVVFHGGGVRRDDVRRFDEVACAAGVLGRLAGRDLMPMILDHLDRAKLRGLMDTPEDQPYWPGDREPWRT